jgi:hypothetical protein
MDNKEFLRVRKKLARTQKQMAGLLGTSLKAVQSYEQGWRTIPAHAERQIYFLLSMRRENKRNQRACWVIKKCPPETKMECPAWEFQSGRLCWFINGTMCEGVVQKDWQKKMKICRSCEVIISLL